MSSRPDLEPEELEGPHTENNKLTRDEGGDMLACHNELTLEEVFNGTPGEGKGEQLNIREELPPLPPSPPTSPLDHTGNKQDPGVMSPAQGGGTPSIPTPNKLIGTPVHSPRPSVKKKRLLRDLKPTSMVDKSLKDLQQECRILKLPIPGTKSELKDRIRRARSGQTTIMFTPRKRGRPPKEEDGELLGTPMKKGRASTALPSPEVKTEVREGPTKPPSNKDEHGHQNESIQKDKEITGIKEGEGVKPWNRG